MSNVSLILTVFVFVLFRFQRIKPGLVSQLFNNLDEHYHDCIETHGKLYMYLSQRSESWLLDFRNCCLDSALHPGDNIRKWQQTSWTHNLGGKLCFVLLYLLSIDIQFWN